MPSGSPPRWRRAAIQVKEGDDTITLEVGTNNWPYPIPLVQGNGQWHFDTAAGKEEIINRHIGKDELYAIGVCRTYVTAQRQYASANTAAGGAFVEYAQHFKSTPGKKDGLYWPAAENEPASPFGPLVAEAQAEGYVIHKRGSASVSRLLFQDSDPARAGRARRAKWIT
jgi:hypothetical protein